ncbi:1,3-beta-galactosyl-N-acetylhexosamine phosphorylase [compost metagenome]
MRSLYYAAGREAELAKWYAANPSCEVHAYPESGVYAVVNNAHEPQTTLVYDGHGRTSEVQLAAGGILWKDIKEGAEQHGTGGNI